MPNPWPDPRDPEREPSKARDFLIWFAAAAIGAGIIGNVARGLMTGIWNW